MGQGARLKALNDFFDWAWRLACECQNPDAGEIQIKAVELGLARITPYDPDYHGSRGAADWGLQPGDDYYVKRGVSPGEAPQVTKP